jgi:hypothetical protein
MLEIERGSTRSHSVEILLWKITWTCCKTVRNEDDTELVQQKNMNVYSQFKPIFDVSYLKQLAAH